MLQFCCCEVAHHQIFHASAHDVSGTYNTSPRHPEMLNSSSTPNPDVLHHASQHKMDDLLIRFFPALFLYPQQSTLLLLPALHSPSVSPLAKVANGDALVLKYFAPVPSERSVSFCFVPYFRLQLQTLCSDEKPEQYVDRGDERRFSGHPLHNECLQAHQ